ncbi:MAG: RnfABCDGE type electron transport complex subunit D, partial [Clostridia bacterium]|nr:RnfABCDGE type electron transport complex subunit D [Clostridia bacterium]
FGGLGKNIVNPALAARIFLFISFPSEMTTYTAVGRHLPVLGEIAADAVTSATPLSSLKAGVLPTETTLNLLFGSLSGCLGEVSALLLLAGGLYLAVRRVIDLRIPLSCLLTVAVLCYFFPQGGAEAVDFMLAELLTGGLVLGAVFMATDYVTSPTTGTGRIIYGVGIGALTVFIRFFGGYPEGVSFAILIMNLFVYYLDRYTKAKPFGKGESKHEAKQSA